MSIISDCIIDMYVFLTIIEPQIQLRKRMHVIGERSSM